jgi:arsenite methyltransferase
MTLDVDQAVRARYSDAAKAMEPSLCCPTSYDSKLLKAIPQEVLERDYGCGDPTTHLAAGETVLDLGSGSGKHCFMAAQAVGPQGRVIGIDMNSDMLTLARQAAPAVAKNIGYANVEFRKGRIQDLGLDLMRLEAELAQRPVRTAEDVEWLRALEDRLRAERALVADNSVDVVVSNCVLNLVRPGDKKQLFREIHRVLRRGGRAVISDIVSDEDIPAHMAADPALWSGCISGAFREDHFLEAFEDAGFYGVSIAEWQSEPWQVVEGIEFRSVTVVAYKGKDGPCLEQNHAVVYRGPFREAVDDDGHRLRRGRRTAVCAKTYDIYSRAPYAEQFEFIESANPTPLDDAEAFGCTGGARRRDPKETKGGRHHHGSSDGGTDGSTSTKGRGGGCC